VSLFFRRPGHKRQGPVRFRPGPQGFVSSPQFQRTRVPIGPPERVVVVVVVMAAKQFMAVSVA
jgi:hypothetical protein